VRVEALEKCAHDGAQLAGRRVEHLQAQLCGGDEVGRRRWGRCKVRMRRRERARHGAAHVPAQDGAHLEERRAEMSAERGQIRTEDKTFISAQASSTGKGAGGEQQLATGHVRRGASHLSRRSDQHGAIGRWFVAEHSLQP